MVLWGRLSRVPGFDEGSAGAMLGKFTQIKERKKTMMYSEEIKKKKGRQCLSGSGVIELILIMLVLIAVLILFKDQITALADVIFGDIFTKAESVF